MTERLLEKIVAHPGLVPVLLSMTKELSSILKDEAKTKEENRWNERYHREMRTYEF